MKILLGVGFLLLIAASLVADYKWKQWMAARRADRESDPRAGRPNS